MPMYTPPTVRPYRVIYGPGDGDTYRTAGPPPLYILWTRYGFTMDINRLDEAEVYQLRDGCYVQRSMLL